MISRLLIGLSSLLLSAVLFAAEKPITVRFSNQEYAPYMGEQLPFGGILSRVVSEVFRRGKVTVHYRWYPNNRTILMARNGDVDGSIGWTPTEERRTDLLFTDEVVPFRMVLFQRLGETYSWNTLADLSAHRFGITAGNFYSDEFVNLQTKGLLNVEVASDDVSNFRKLAAGRIDLFPMEGEAGLLTARMNLPPSQAARVVPMTRAYWSTPLCVAIWNRHPQAQELHRRFNRELKKMQDTGELELLINQTRHAIFAQLDKKGG